MFVNTWSSNSTQRNNRHSVLRKILPLTITAGLVSIATPSLGAENIVLTYGAFGRTVPVSEFETLAQTGTATGTLKQLLKLTKESPSNMQKALNSEVKIKAVWVDGLLNTAPGKFLLSELGKIVHTPSQKGNVQALRSALVLSASNDNSLSLLEVFQNYPTSDLVVDGVQIQRDVKEVKAIEEDIETEAKSILATVQSYLGHLECNCTP